MLQPLKYNSDVSFCKKPQNNSTLLKIENPLKLLNNEKSAADDITVQPTPIQDSVSIENKDSELSKTSTDDKTLQKNKTSLTTKFLNFLKGFNDVKDTTQGVIKGAVKGSAAFALISVIGRKSKDNQGKIPSILGDLAKSAALTVWSGVKAIPSLLTKSPVENIKNVAKIPKEFCERNLKTTVEKAGKTVTKIDKSTAALAVATGLAILGIETIRGKMKANKQNSNIDHNLYLNHTKKEQ